MKREKPEKINGIIVPDEYRERYAGHKCKVVAVGDGCEPEIKDLVGKWVLKGQHAGAWLDEDGKPIPEGEFYICEEGDLLAVV